MKDFWKNEMTSDYLSGQAPDVRHRACHTGCVIAYPSMYILAWQLYDQDWKLIWLRIKLLYSDTRQNDANNFNSTVRGLQCAKTQLVDIHIMCS